jgi:hypothetical protein
MKHVHVFHHDFYHHTLEHQIGGGLPVFTGYRQRGGGLGSILGYIGKYAFPLLKKYVLPHVGSAVIDTISDLKHGHPMKEAIGKNAIKMGKNVAKSVLTQQTGRGLGAKKRKVLLGATADECSQATGSDLSLKIPKKVKISSKIQKKPKTQKTRKSVSKTDIFGKWL